MPSHFKACTEKKREPKWLSYESHFSTQLPLEACFSTNLILLYQKEAEESSEAVAQDDCPWSAYNRRLRPLQSPNFNSFTLDCTSS